MLNPFWFWKRFKRKRFEREASNNEEKNTLNKIDVNKAYEGIPCNMAVNYSNVLKTLFMTVFFCPLIPIALPFGIVSVVLLYWSDKYILLRRNNSPK